MPKNLLNMKRVLIALMCFASLSVLAQNTPVTADNVIEPLVLEEDESTLEGYMLEADLPEKIQKAYGIEGFGRVRGFEVQRALSFSGEGASANVPDGFQFEFVPTEEVGTFSHDVFLAYSKAIYDKCLKAADDGKIVNGFWDGAKQLSFEDCIKMIDKEQDRKRCKFFYINQGRKRSVEIVERNYTNGGFGLLYVELRRQGR